MKNFDFKKIKDSLPHGAITEIAEKVGVDPRTVSEVFNEGWHKDIRNEVVSCALAILKRSNIDPAIIKEATAMNLTTDSPMGSRRFGKKKRKLAVHSGMSKMFGGDSMPVIIGLAIVAVLFLAKPKTSTL